MFACLAPDGTTIGFLSSKPNSEFAVEIHVMGVKESWHRMGIGRALITTAKEHAASQGARFLTVKTVCKSDENYAATRAFYQSVGFLPPRGVPHTLLLQIQPLTLPP